MKHFNLEKGVLIISIDLELAWGFNYELLKGFKVAEKYLRIIKERSRRNVEKLLEVSERFNVPFTWGVVGHLFLSSCSRDNGCPHSDMPRPKLDVNKDWYANDPCSSIDDDPLWYGSDMIKRIRGNKVEHEIACHSFSHTDFSRCSREVALAEVRKCKEIMSDHGIQPKTFIFPKERIGHLQILEEENFKIFRFGINHPQSSLYQKLIFPIQQVLFPMTGLPIKSKGLVGVPSSLLFQSPRKIDVSRLLLATKRGIRYAVEKKEIFHITMHDYLEYDILLDEFAEMLSYAKRLEEEKKLDILTMYKCCEEIEI